MKTVFYFIGLSILLVILGFFVRFYSINEPKEVVFDEFFFFHFVSDYEQNQYFFDIHPPLGKLLLWQNAKFFGIEDYVEKINDQKKFRENFIIESLALKRKISEKEKLSPLPKSDPEISALKDQYDALYTRYQKQQNTPLEKYTIGTPYDDALQIGGIRGFSAFFGVVLLPLVFAFVFLLTQSFSLSFFSGFLLLFSPALTVESQYVLMDSFLIFVVISGIYALFRFRHTKSASTKWKWWIIASVFAGLSVSTKWTGLSVLAIAGLVLFFDSYKNNTWREFFLKGFCIWAVTVVIYVSTFFIHFTVLSQSGSGDVYHTPQFKATLQNTTESQNPEISQQNFWEKFLELNIQMGSRSAEISDNHPYDSRPIDWIQGKGRIFYWENPNAKETHPRTKQEQKIFEKLLQNTIQLNIFTLPGIWKKLFFTQTDRDKKLFIRGRFEEKQEIHLFANSILWKILTVSTLFVFILSLWYWRKSQKFPEKKLENSQNAENLVVIGFAIVINILPFVFISRPEFLYHAFMSFVLAVIGLSLVIHHFLGTNLIGKKSENFWKNLLYNLVLFSLGGYVFYFFVTKLPIIYGFPFPLSMNASVIPL